MLAYFDSSALVPLVIDEPSTARVRTAWNAAHRVTTSLLSYVEARAALARAERSHRIGSDQHQQAIAVAIDAQLHQFLHMARAFALDPEGLPGP